MKPDNGCIDCKLFVMQDCRASKHVYFDTKVGADVVFYGTPNGHRGDNRHCPDHIERVPLWKTIWDKIRRNK